MALSATIDSVDDVNEGGTRSLTATVTGVVYEIDSASWWVSSGPGSVTKNSDTTATYTAPVDVSSDTSVTIRYSVTEYYGKGNTHSASASVTFKVLNVLPDAEAGTVTVDDVGTVTSGATVSLSRSVSGGIYDTLSTTWTRTAGLGTFTDSIGPDASFTAPITTQNHDVTVKATTVFSGTGTKAKDGTSDSASGSETFTVEPEHSSALAGTVSIAPVSSVSESSSITLSRTISGGTYDTTTTSWSVVSGVGSFSDSTGSSATYNAPDVTQNSLVTVKATVTFKGTGTNAATGTSASASDTVTFTVTSPDTPPPAKAGTVTIGSISTVNENTPKTVSRTISGGTYDETETTWSVSSGVGSFSDSTGASGVYDAPEVSQDSSVTIKATVVFKGTGTNAKADTSATASDTEPFTVIEIPPPPLEAEAPSVTITDISSLWEREEITVSATVSSGRYDTLSYAWTPALGSISGSGSSVTYRAPSVNSNTNTSIVCVVTARGAGANAEDGSSDTSSDSVSFLIYNHTPPAPKKRKIRVGNDKITRVYLGDDIVHKAYLGNHLLFD